eukprot:547674_1
MNVNVITTLCKLFGNDFKWIGQSSLHLDDAKEEESNDFDLQSLAKLHFNAKIDIKQYLKQIMKNQYIQQPDHMQDLGITERNIIAILDTLLECNWNWLFNRNYYGHGNLPIAAIFREDQIAVTILKETHSLLETA